MSDLFDKVNSGSLFVPKKPEKPKANPIADNVQKFSKPIQDQASQQKAAGEKAVADRTERNAKATRNVSVRTDYGTFSVPVQGWDNKSTEEKSSWLREARSQIEANEKKNRAETVQGPGDVSKPTKDWGSTYSDPGQPVNEDDVFNDTVKKGVTKAANDFLANTPMGYINQGIRAIPGVEDASKQIATKGHELAKNMHVNVGENKDPSAQGWFDVASAIANTPAGLVEDAANIYDPNVDLVGKTQSFGNIAASVVGAGQTIGAANKFLKGIKLPAEVPPIPEAPVPNKFLNGIDLPTEPPPKVVAEQPVPASPNAGLFNAPEYSVPIPEKLYHGSNIPFSKLDDQPLYFTTPDKLHASIYAESGGRGSVKIDDPMAVSDEGVAYKRNGDTWTAVGELDENGYLNPLKTKYPDINNKVMVQNTDPNRGTWFGVNQKAYIHEINAKGHLLDLTDGNNPENVFGDINARPFPNPKVIKDVIGNLDPKGDPMAKNIIDYARSNGVFRWEDTTMMSNGWRQTPNGAAQTKAWKIIGDQLKEKGYSGIRFIDQTGVTDALFDNPTIKSHTELRSGVTMQIKPQPQETAIPEQPKVAASNLSSADQRTQMGYGERDNQVKMTRAMAEANPVDVDHIQNLANTIVHDVEVNGKKPPVVDAETQAAMGQAVAAKGQQVTQAKAALANAIANGEDTTALQLNHDALVDQHLNLIKANEHVGTAASATFRARNYAYTDLDTPAGVYNEGTIAKGAKLTDKEAAELEGLRSKVQELETKIAKSEKARVEAAVRQMSKPQPGRRIARTDVEIKATRADAVARMKQSMKNAPIGSGLGAFQDFDYRALADYAMTFVEQGVGKVEDIVKLAGQSLRNEGVNIADDDVMEAMKRWATPKETQRKLDTQIMLRDRARKELRRALDDLKLTATQKVFREATSLPRALQATADMSATMRQGALLGAGNPVKMGQAFSKAMRALADPVYSHNLERELFSSPMAVVRKRAGLYIADKGGLNLGEEAFMSNLVEKIPGFGKIAAASERHYETFLNQLRASVFDDMVAKYPDMTIQEQKALADFINVATGRGRVSPGIAQATSQVLFSPRFAASRIQAPLDALAVTKNGRAMWKSPAARRQMLQSWGGLIAGGTTLAGLAKLAGGDVSLDPQSPDFGKIRFGDTRFDIWGGFQQPVRVVARFADDIKKHGTEKASSNAVKNTGNFFRYKLAPVPNLLLGASTGKDAINQPFMRDKSGKVTPAAVGEDAVKMVSPLVIKDLAELWTGDAPKPVKVIGSAGVLLGTGVSTYKK